MADFDSWSKQSLVQFAYDAQQKLREQQEEIKRLQMQLDFSQQDVTCALVAYRELLRGWPSPDAARNAARH
jgi:hypothetical protein